MMMKMIVTITSYFSQDYLDSPSLHQAHLGGNQFPIFQSVSPSKLLKQIYPVVVYTERKRKNDLQIKTVPLLPYCTAKAVYVPQSVTNRDKSESLWPTDNVEQKAFTTRV